MARHSRKHLSYVWGVGVMAFLTYLGALTREVQVYPPEFSQGRTYPLGKLPRREPSTAKWLRSPATCEVFCLDFQYLTLYYSLDLSGTLHIVKEAPCGTMGQQWWRTGAGREAVL